MKLLQSPIQDLRGGLQRAQLGIYGQARRIDQNADGGRLRNDLNQSLQTDSFQLLIEDAHPRYVPAGAGKAAHKPHGDRVSAAREYNRNGQGCAFRGKSRGIPECRNERDVIAYQIAGELGQAIEFTIGITKLQDDVASLDVVGAGQPAAKCRQSMGAIAVQDGSPVLASKS